MSAASYAVADFARLPALRFSVCDPLALFDRGDEVRAAIELVDDFEDGFVAFRRRRVLGEQHADAQVRLGAQVFRDQGVGGLLHAVVQETVRIIRHER